MASLTVHREAHVLPAWIAARDRYLLSAQQATDSGVLCVYECVGDVLGLGRLHVVPESENETGPVFHRRLGAGRPVPLGEGFFGISMVLPTQALLDVAGAATASLMPEQVLNRAVRGVLGALEALGVPGYYPGRDLVTANKRTIGALTLEIEPSGATLVEMVVAGNRSFAEITSFLDRADPAGSVQADVVMPEQATSIVGETGRHTGLATFADALCAAYETRLGMTCIEAAGPIPALEPDAAWLRAGRLPAGLDRHASVRILLGWLQIHLAMSEGRIVDARLTGDVIASASAIAKIESGLRGLLPEHELVIEVVRAAVREPHDFVLGVRPLEAIADLVLRACEA